MSFKSKMLGSTTENYLTYLLNLYVPNWSYPFVTFIILFFQYAVYKSMDKYRTLQSCYEGGSSDDFNEYVTYKFGSKNNRAMTIKYQEEIWRLFTSLFVHQSESALEDISITAFPLMIIMEVMFGNLNFAIIYFASGMYGNLFGSTFVPATSMGCYPAVYGLFGAISGYLLINVQGIKTEVWWAAGFLFLFTHVRNVY